MSGPRSVTVPRRFSKLPTSKTRILAPMVIEKLLICFIELQEWDLNEQLHGFK